MARRLLGTLPLALGLLFVACADQNDSGPTAPHAGGLAATQSGTGCNFTVFNSLIAQYFTSSARQQQASTYVNAMQTATGGAFSQGAVDAGFNLLAYIASTVDSTYRGFGTSGPAATGSSLAQATIRCMYDNLTLPDFTVSVDPASKGAFQVRGGSGDATTTPVIARRAVGSEPISVVAPTPGGNWGQIVKTAALPAVATRALIYGRPVLSDPSDPTSAPDPLQYQWEAIHPDIVFTDPSAVVAICAAEGDTDWIQESGLGILAYQSAGSLCTPRVTQSVSFLDGGWRPSLLASRLVRLLSPAPLSAAVLAKSTGGTAGGLKSIFSKKAVPNAALKFVAPFPSPSPKVNGPITVTVEARDVDQTLMNGVTVTITGTNNNGTPTMIFKWNGTSCTASSGPPSGVTGANGTGVVTITFCVTKNGGLLTSGTGTAKPLTVFAPTQTLKLNVKP
jgi:hypothetical protein